MLPLWTVDVAAAGVGDSCALPATDIAAMLLIPTTRDATNLEKREDMCVSIPARRSGRPGSRTMTRNPTCP